MKSSKAIKTLSAANSSNMNSANHLNVFKLKTNMALLNSDVRVLPNYSSNRKTLDQRYSYIKKPRSEF
jgi:hypothetical protein